MGIVTKRGDGGHTQLWSGERVSKDSLRIEIEGCLDELSSVIGIARASSKQDSIAGALRAVQEDLVAAASVVASASDHPGRPSRADLQRKVERVEHGIDDLESGLPRSTAFVVPGEDAVSAHIHHARTIARRCERRAVQLSRSEHGLLREIVVLLNRHSDYLWLLARKVEEEKQ